MIDRHKESYWQLVGTVGTAVGTIVFCVGTVGTGEREICYIPLPTGPYGPYAKNSGPYSGPYGPYAETKRFETTSDARGHRPEHTEISEWPSSGGLLDS